MFSKKATKIEETFTVYLTICSKCQIDSEDFASFCGLLRKHELYHIIYVLYEFIFKSQVSNQILKTKVYSAANDLRTNLRTLHRRNRRSLYDWSARIYKVAVLVAYSPSLLYPSPADAAAPSRTS